SSYLIVSNEPTLPWRGPPAGGGYTTAADLMKFAGALMSNRLLKAETLPEATQPQFTTGASGLGFQLGPPDEVRTYGHGGGAPGMNGILRVYPESGQSVIVLCNLDSPSAERMGDWLHARTPLKQFPPPSPGRCRRPRPASLPRHMPGQAGPRPPRRAKARRSSGRARV